MCLQMKYRLIYMPRIFASLITSAMSVIKFESSKDARFDGHYCGIDVVRQHIFVYFNLIGVGGKICF